MSVWRLLWAWIGPKGSSRRSLDLLPLASDLPGRGWQQVGERTWKTARFRSDSDWVRRAGRINSTTGTRWFTNPQLHCKVTLSVYPLLSDEDARAAVHEGPSLRSGLAKSLGEERIAGDVAIPSSPATWASEQLVVPHNGSPAVTRFLRGCAGPVLFSLVGSGSEHQPDVPPAWDSLVQIAEVVIARIAAGEGQEERGMER